MTRRTLLFCQYGNPDLYPTTVRLTQHFAGRGWRVHIVCSMDSPTLIPSYGPGITLERIPRPRGLGAGSRAFTTFLGRATSAALRHAPSVVFGFDARGAVAAAPAARVARAAFVYHLYDLMDGVGHRAVRALDAWCMDRATAVVVASRAKQRYLQEHGVRRPLLVMANSAPLQARRHTRRIHEILAARGITARTVVYYHGSIGHGKGLMDAIASMPAWPDGSVLVLVGLVHQPSVLDDLLRLAAARGVGHRVVFLGVVPLPELFDLTCSADLALYTPTTEELIHTTSGEAVVKLNDYMACGVPAVVSDLPALATFMQETHAGVSVDVRDVAKLGETIGGLLRDDVARLRLADAAHRAHVDTYNLAVQIEPLLAAVPALAG